MTLLNPDHPVSLVRERVRDIFKDLHNQHTSLKQLLVELEGPETLLSNVLRLYNAIAREVYEIEASVVGPLSRWGEEDKKLTVLTVTACKEVKIKEFPVVLATSEMYYRIFPKYGVITVPATESRGLLNLPDLFHELGHYGHYHRQKIFSNRTLVSIRAYLDKTEQEQQRLARPIKPDWPKDFEYVWTNRWAEEIACDVFATFLVGPAYGWANLHLILRQPTPFGFSITHPADAARMDNILRVLKRMELHEPAQEIESAWNKFKQTQGYQPPIEYTFFHPEEVFTAIAEDVEDSIEEAKLHCYDGNRSGVIQILNEAWSRLRSNLANYIEWESQRIENFEISNRI